MNYMSEETLQAIEHALSTVLQVALDGIDRNEDDQIRKVYWQRRAESARQAQRDFWAYQERARLSL